MPSASLLVLLEAKLKDALAPKHLEVINESHMHNVPKGSESHFKVILVSDSFKDLNLVSRHQKVYAILQDEMKKSIHALALHCYTTPEWQRKMNKAPDSPKCHGRST